MPKVPPFHPVGFAAQLVADRGIDRVRIEGAGDLLATGGVLVDETGRDPLGGARLLLVAQAVRAGHTFETVIADCQIGRGVQASMLNRSLLEDALDIHWVAANPDQAPERAEEHDRLIGLAEHLLQQRFGRTDRPLNAHQQGELERLTELYGGSGPGARGRALRASWTRASFHERFQLLRERWEDAAGPDLDYVYEVIQRQNNVLLHGSPTGYRQAMSVDTEGRPRQINRIGPDRRWREALGHGALAYYFVARVMAAEFGLDRNPVEQAFYAETCYLKPIDVGYLADLPDGAACPCDSGRTVEACHRS